MIIAIDATSIGSQQGREETVTRSLLRGLAAVIRPRAQVLVLASAGADLPREAGPRRGFVVDRVIRRPRSVHFGYTLPQWLATLVRRAERPDVVVTLTNTPLWSPAPVALMAADPRCPAPGTTCRWASGQPRATSQATAAGLARSSRP